MVTRALIAAAATIVALALVAFAVASAGDNDDDRGGVLPTPTPEAEGPRDPASPPTEEPTVAPGGDEPTAGPGTPIPSEPIIPVTPADPEDPQLPPGRRAEEAPIDGLDVRIAESFPPQYFLNVQAGLPSGCAEQYKHEVARDGRVITVTVLNSFPDEPDVICTAIYGMYQLNFNLGSDFESGETYTVSVNGEEITFTAQ